MGKKNTAGGIPAVNLASDSDGCEIHQSGEGGIACLVIGGDVSHVLQPDHRRFGRDIKGIGDAGTKSCRRTSLPWYEFGIVPAL